VEQQGKCSVNIIQIGICPLQSTVYKFHGVQSTLNSAIHLEIPRLYTTSRFVVFTGNRHGPCPEFQQNQRILQNLRPYVLKANSNSTKFVSRQAIIQNVYRKISTERFESRRTNHARTLCNNIPVNWCVCVCARACVQNGIQGKRSIVMSISFTGFAHIWLDRHKLELTHFHSFSHSGSFLQFLSHPHCAKDDINDIAYLRGHAVFLPHSRNTTLSQMPVSQSGLYDHWLSSAIRLRVSGSSLQMLRSNPLPQSSGYLAKGGSSETL
jgi:hypothetical protein